MVGLYSREQRPGEEVSPRGAAYVLLVRARSAARVSADAHGFARFHSVTSFC